jgi:hypothetical protein
MTGILIRANLPDDPGIAEDSRRAEGETRGDEPIGCNLSLDFPLLREAVQKL